MKKQLLLSLIAFVSITIAKAQTNIPALITSNQIWDISGSPYLLNQNSYIDTGVSVIVMPGVEVRATGSYRIDINGEFQARGKWDSIIFFNKMDLQFSKNSKDYKSSTGRGAYFNYCKLTGNGSGVRIISVTTTSLKVTNCVFSDAYNAIYMQSSYPYDTIVTDISNSTFTGDMYGYGSPISCNIMESKLTVTNCIFKNAYNIYTYGNVVFKNNLFYKMTNLNFGYMFGNSEISCNRFIRLKDGLTLDLNTYNNYKVKPNLTFTNNTFDSIGNSTSLAKPFIEISRGQSLYANFGKLVVNNNNFLTNVGKGSKVGINSNNQSPTKTDSLNFKDNYWGSNDSTTIASYIKDYNDDITIYGRAIFAKWINAPIIGCSYNTECARANFVYTQNDSIITFKDSSFGSKPYRVKWKFGDGNSNNSNQKNITHSYDLPGTYRAVLYVTDTFNNLCDSMAKVIVIKSKSKCVAAYYFAVDSSDLSVVYIVNKSKGGNSDTKFYWTFGDGTGSNLTNPNHTYASPGRYQICLTIFDTLVNCYSTFCDSVVIDTAGIELLVINQDDLLNIKKPGLINGISVYPNPSVGRLNLKLNNYKSNLIVVDIINSNGQIVKTQAFVSTIGNNTFALDVEGLPNGFYCVAIRSENIAYTVKFTIEK